MKRDHQAWREMQWLLLGGVMLLLLLAAWPLLRASAPASKVTLNAANVGPREIEDTTQTAIVRDYSRAWEAMTEALANNNEAMLEDGFVGVAKQQLADEVEAQKKSGLRTRYIDHGHKLDAIFYSPDGSAMELRDTAQVELQVLDGSSVVHSENVTLHYVALMTTAENRWKVRLLQAVPAS